MNGLSLPIRIRGETGSNTERKRKTEGIMMTKKLFTGIAVVALIGVLSAAAFAAPGAGRGRGAGMGARTSYTDTNRDGVCDNYGTASGTGTRFTDTDGNGVCDHYGTKSCSNYADDDGDGVCDNAGSAARPRNGTGMKRGWNR